MSTKTLQELLDQRKALDAEIETIQTKEKSKVIAQVRELVKSHGLTMRDVFPLKGATNKAVTVKYRNAETGATWSGRGKQPRWLDGKDKQAFAV